MTKELEALERLANGVIDGSYYRQATDSSVLVKQDKDVVKKALIPPTADEVCEALKERFGKTVKMDSDKNFYYSFVSQHYGEVDEIICGYSWDDGCISFEKDLPTNLVIMVGRFYEGLGK